MGKNHPNVDPTSSRACERSSRSCSRRACSRPTPSTASSSRYEAGHRADGGRARGGARVDGPRVQAAPARGPEARRSPSSALDYDDLVVTENTPAVHNLVVCTLCSCYPWAVMGLPPDLVQDAGLPLARGERAARGAEASSASTSRPSARSACGTAARSCDTWCCPMAPAGDRAAGRGRARRRMITRDALIGVADVQPPAPAR